MSSKWTALAKCPVSRFSNIVFISTDEFVIAPYHYSKQKADGIMKYNTKKNKWTVLVKYPKDFEISNCSLSFDETSNTLYLIGAESTVHVISLDTKKIKPLHNGHVEVGVNCKSLFVDGSLHIIGGSKNRHHLCRQILSSDTPATPSTPAVSNGAHGDDDEKEVDNGFSSLFEFEDWTKGVQNCGLVFVRSKRQFILFGGNLLFYAVYYKTNSTHFVLPSQVTTNIPTTNIAIWSMSSISMIHSQNGSKSVKCPNAPAISVCC